MTNSGFSADQCFENVPYAEKVASSLNKEYLDIHSVARSKKKTFGLETFYFNFLRNLLIVYLGKSRSKVVMSAY